ncbi:phage tail tape measure protein [Anianabacter salinae]|uniref:phage tail tape measure protein n=1 Tax=Anianabacter salinae TaxID=2851023 RepID=UPI00225E4563|nr:phage tail tape measure protein [Anianabacter salinae]MBV0912949.1 phage tail tape measure protein [Anianabacter salinae]
MDDWDRLDDHAAALEGTLGGASALVAAFDGSLREMQATVAGANREVNVLSGGIGRGLRRAFDGLVFDGMKLSDALAGVAKSMADAAYSAAIRPVTSHFGGLLARGVEGLVQGVLPFADGAAFSQGRVMPFAKGGVVSTPTSFPMRGATGLMGEAGPEAILPLARGADGRLGVAQQGGRRAVSVQVNVSTPDVEGFRRSHSQIAAEMGRAIQRGQRNR